MKIVSNGKTLEISIGGSNGCPNGIDEYDTEDGWHVRKWADGYVEMIGSFTYNLLASSWHTWGSVYSVSTDVLPLYPYPISLSVIYSEVLDVAPGESAVIITCGIRESNNKTKHYGFCRGTAFGSNTNLKLNYIVTGRWK